MVGKKGYNSKQIVRNGLVHVRKRKTVSELLNRKVYKLKLNLDYIVEIIPR